MISALDHVAIAVTSLPEACATFEKLGLSFAPPEEVPAQKVRVAVCHIGDVKIELLEPMEGGSPIQAFLEKRGPGLHHLAFRSSDLQEEVQNARNQGFRLLQEGICQGADGNSICFLHPSSTGRVLIELCQSGGVADGKCA